MLTKRRPLKNAHTCLLVEDDAVERKQVERLMRQSGRRALLLSVPTIAQARSLLADQAVDLILLDNTLPDGVGAEFALELSQHPKLGRIPVAIISEWPTPFMYAKAEKAGVLGVLRKKDLTPNKIGQVWDDAKALTKAAV